jgi:hypothetical protein
MKLSNNCIRIGGVAVALAIQAFIILLLVQKLLLDR